MSLKFFFVLVQATGGERQASVCVQNAGAGAGRSVTTGAGWLMLYFSLTSPSQPLIPCLSLSQPVLQLSSISGAAANASLEPQDDLLLAPSSDDRHAASTPTQPAPPSSEPQPQRALSTLETQLDDDVEELDEEQQLQMAMRMSMQP